MTVIEHAAAGTRPVAAASPARPFAKVRGRRLVLPAAGRELALLASIYTLYAATRWITAGGAGAAMSNGRRVLQVERVAGLAPEHWLNQAVAGRAFLAVPADYAYATLHYVVTLVVLVWLWRAHRTAYLPARRALVAATVLGLVGFLFLPVAPPRMLPGFIDTMARYGSDGWWGSEASAPKGLGSLTNQFAAMPSLHVGWAIWCGVMVARHARRAWVRWLAVGYPVAVVLVVLSTANHYLLDAAAGVAAVAAGLAVSRAVVRLGLLSRPHPHRSESDDTARDIAKHPARRQPVCDVGSQRVDANRIACASSAPT